MRNFFNGEDREVFDRVVISGVIAERPFGMGLVRFDESFENDFSRCRHQQVVREATGDVSLRVTQESCELEFRNCVGNR